MTNSAMTLPFTPLAKLVPRPNSTCQVPPLLPFFSTYQNTLLHSPTHSTIPHLLLVIYYKRTLKTHACNHSYYTPHPMRYMLHVQSQINVKWHIQGNQPKETLQFCTHTQSNNGPWSWYNRHHMYMSTIPICPSPSIAYHPLFHLPSFPLHPLLPSLYVLTLRPLSRSPPISPSMCPPQ